MMLGVLLMIVATALGAQVEPFLATPLANSVPGTLQTLALLTGSALLGPTKGVFATVIYLTLGMVGLPVFSDWASYSLTELVEYPSAGYLVGFLPGSALAGALAARSQRLPALLGVMLAGHLMILLFGVPIFAASINWETALDAGMVQLLPGMAIKTLLGALIIYRVRVSRRASTSTS
ncbi:MAG: biotin transporter BioY [Planctomycetes bacterium]|nr:biotin transporter BioY [Planctomycetota bacterium]